MPATDLYPQDQNQDIGLGVTFFAHPYLDRDDHKIYYRHSHLPILGYCPGCSSKAHLNLTLTLQHPSSSSYEEDGSSMSTSSSPISIRRLLSYEDKVYAQKNQAEQDDGCPNNGEMVVAETHHAGPSYSNPEFPVDESELRRCQLVRRVLDNWANADARKKAEAKRIEARKKREEERREEILLRRFEWEAEEGRLERAYEGGFVRMVDKSMRDEREEDDRMVFSGRNSFAGSPTTYNQSQSGMGRSKENDKPGGEKSGHGAKIKEKLKSAGSTTKRHVGLGLGLVSSGQAFAKKSARQSPGLGLGAYDDETDSDHEPESILID